MIIKVSDVERLVVKEIENRDYYLSIEIQKIYILFGINCWISISEFLIDKDFDNINNHRDVDPKIEDAWNLYKQVKNGLTNINSLS